MGPPFTALMTFTKKDGDNGAPLALNKNEASSAGRTHLLSKGKITFQSFFMLMTVQPFFVASS